jgi:hypothetical protein
LAYGFVKRSGTSQAIARRIVIDWRVDLSRQPTRYFTATWQDISISIVYPRKTSTWKSISSTRSNRMLLTCRYPNPQHLLIPIITSLPLSMPIGFSPPSLTRSTYREEALNHRGASHKSWQPPPSNSQHSPARPP